MVQQFKHCFNGKAIAIFYLYWMYGMYWYLKNVLLCIDMFLQVLMCTDTYGTYGTYCMYSYGVMINGILRKWYVLNIFVCIELYL